jgi:hypothetical protein
MDVSDACRSLIRSPQRIPSSLYAIDLFADTEPMMHGSREDRVLAFEEFVRRSDGTSAHNPEVMSFMLGYFASRIAPGTIRHSKVLDQITLRYPTAMLWYGFCSGFGESRAEMTDVSPKAGPDLPLSARRVIRELLRPETILGTPVCDIGYLELLALSRTGGSPLESLVRATQGSIAVELLPGVCTSLNVSLRPSDDLQAEESRKREAMAKIGQQIERLRELYRDLLSAQTAGRKPEQPPLFPSRRKKK